MRFLIWEARRVVGITQAELAQRSGVGRTVINGLETGARTVTSTRTLEKLAAALGTSVRNLIGEGQRSG